MNHIMQINELFGLDKPKEGDALIVNLIKIIEEENIPVQKNPNGSYTFEIDRQEFKIQTETGVAFLGGASLTKIDKVKYYGPEYKISIKYWYQIEKIAKEQRINAHKGNLDNDLDEFNPMKRTARKYNL